MSNDDADDEPVRWQETEALLSELRRVAHRILRSSAPQTLRTDDLVDTVLHRMFEGDGAWDYDRLWENRAHFIGSFVQAAQNRLIDHHKKRTRQKRGGRQQRLSFEDLAEPQERVFRDPDLCLDLLDCMERVVGGDEGRRAVLGSKLLLECTEGDIATLLDLPRTTVRDRLKRMLREMQSELSAPP